MYAEIVEALGPGAIKQLTEIELKKTEAKITMEELTACLAKTRNNVAPGSSGFSGAFYKVFWVDLRSLVLTAIHCIFEDITLPASQRYGIVTIIPKAGKDNTPIQNWQPLTLLNTLYKLVSSILSFRLKQPIKDIRSSPACLYTREIHW